MADGQQCMNTTPDVTALNTGVPKNVEARCDAYAKSSDRVLADHGNWLKDKIARWKQRSVTQAW